MTDKHELIALAERVEALTGADRNIDTEILWHVNRGSFSRGYWNAASGMPRPLEAMPQPNSGLGWIGAQCNAPPYTASLDAAMKLVPEGWWWTTGNCSVSADASMGPDVAHCPKEMLLAFDEGLHHDLPHPSTPAISLTALALRARAAIIEWERQQ